MGKRAAKAVKSARSENPLDWLYDNPLGPFPNFTFGVLKRSYHGHTNTAVEFGGRKLRPIKPTSADPDAITAYRYGTVLPKDAPDELDDAFPLLAAIDAASCPHEAALLIYVTLAFPRATRLHHCWEEGRAFCLEKLAIERRCPVLLCQHRPGDVASDNPVHLHLLIGPRRIDGTGHRGYATDLICDHGQRLLHDEWLAFRKAWRR
jgi:hypothetical protein